MRLGTSMSSKSVESSALQFPAAEDCLNQLFGDPMLIRGFLSAFRASSRCRSGLRRAGDKVWPVQPCQLIPAGHARATPQNDHERHAVTN